MRVRRGPAERTDQEGRLPIRWAVILIISTAIGWAVGIAQGPLAGILAALAAAGTLHELLA